jgi:NAD(P)-dependent dehydrogenase (short-subunit alcohol dehydrogenase family)
MTVASNTCIVVGNSDGIGLALTRRLLDEGWTVTGLSRSPSGVTHERYRHEVVDVTKDEYPSVLAEAADSMGGLGLCVYAAGIGELLDRSAPDFAEQTRTFEVNLMGAVRTVEVVVPRMIAAGGGHLIGLSSLADGLVSGDAPGYAASKAALSTYLMGLSVALRKQPVRVSTVRFGFVDTKMAKGTSTPMKISVAAAVDVLMRCVRTRRGVVSHPRRAAAVTALLRGVTRAQARQRG